MAVPYTFGTATAAIPLSQLDSNFATAITIGNTAVQLGNTVTTLNNMTLANVTISSGTVTITNVAVTTANVSGTANISTLVVVGNETVGGNTTITGNITAANANVTTNLVMSGGTANGVAYLNGSKVVTTGSALGFDGTNLLLGTPSVLTSGKFSLQADLSAVNAMTLRDSGTTYGVSSYYTLYQNSAGSTVGGIGHTAVTSLGINATTDLQFFIAASEKMRIAGATGGVGAVGIGYTSLTSVGDNGLAVLGNVGIGTSSPALKLDVNGSIKMSGGTGTALTWDTAISSQYLKYDSTFNGLILAGYSGLGFRVSGATTNNMTLESSGNLLVGTTSSDAGVRLKVVGGIINCLDVYNNTTASAANVQIDSNGNFARSTSSLKYKTNVQNATHGLSDLLQLRSVTYKGKSENDGEKIFGGLIAEEVDAVGLTEFVQYAEDGTPDALAYGNMVSLCIKAIQEQQALITQLTARITALEGA